jgi:hypothetical protein
VLYQSWHMYVWLRSRVPSLVLLPLRRGNEARFLASTLDVRAIVKRSIPYSHGISSNAAISIRPFNDQGTESSNFYGLMSVPHLISPSPSSSAFAFFLFFISSPVLKTIDSCSVLLPPQRDGHSSKSGPQSATPYGPWRRS